jgi:hypothetical protein
MGREHKRMSSNAVLAFWLAYILTRPLGASIGDYMSQPKPDGGLGLGTTVTSVIFLATILVLVTFLTVTKKDQTPPELIAAELKEPHAADDSVAKHHAPSATGAVATETGNP